MEKFYDAPKAPGMLQKFDTAPWEVYCPPCRMAPHVYFVSGNKDWASYLIDTGDGLILLDTSMSNVLYLLFDSIHRMGFDPKDIKKILITHGHGDHDGGARQIKEFSGADIYISKEDWEMKQTKETRLKVFPYEPDCFYDDEKPIELGNISIRTRRCPGHTPGVTAFFFKDKDEDGTEYLVGMHGGVGGMPTDMCAGFIADCKDMLGLDVDITLPSHLCQINLEPNIPEDKMNYKPFVDRNIWKNLLTSRIAKMSAQLASGERR